MLCKRTSKMNDKKGGKSMKKLIKEVMSPPGYN